MGGGLRFDPGSIEPGCQGAQTGSHLQGPPMVGDGIQDELDFSGHDSSSKGIERL
jgi:hypothetical protein